YIRYIVAPDDKMCYYSETLSHAFPTGVWPLFPTFALCIPTSIRLLLPMSDVWKHSVEFPFAYMLKALP
ncbi:1429_t:CDS:2, partial [Funneliformis mosseae]